MSATPRRLADMSNLTPLSATTTGSDPQTAYRRLQHEWGRVAPVELDSGIPAWLVMGHHDICQIVRNEQLFSRNPHHWRLYAEGGISSDTGLAPMMFPRDNAYFSDGDKHRRLRGPLDDGLASLDNHRISRVIRQRCTDLIDQVSPHGQADLVGDYAAIVPMLTVSALFGLGAEQGHRLRHALIALFGSAADSQAGNEELERILTHAIHTRRAHPSDDLTTAFLHNPNLANDYEIQQSMVLMISAGYETTTTWIAQTLRVMLTEARFASRIRGGRLGIDDALDEVLWRDPPMSNMPARYALADCDIADQPVQRGDALILGLAAANHDPQVRTADPWLEIGNRSHLAWSAGPHACPAQGLGRLITRIAVDTALNHFHSLTLTIPAHAVDVLPSPWTRCPAHLPVRFTPPPAIHPRE